MRDLGIPLLAFILCSALAGPASGRQCEFKHYGPSNHDFGTSVAIDDSHVLIGAPNAQGESGEVHVLDTTTARPKFLLRASDATAGSRFGASVAIRGNLAVIGAPGHGDLGPVSGAAYVFDLSSGLERTKILAHDGGADDHFGTSVALHGARIVVGAPRADPTGSMTGKAYVFDTAGQRLYDLVGLDTAQGDRFGVSVGIHEERIVVGASHHDGTGKDSGAAYLFDAGTAAQLHKLVPLDNIGYDLFGTSVAIWGDRAVAGAPEWYYHSCCIGQAYVFDVSSGSEVATLIHVDEWTSFDVFGTSVAIYGDLVAVGAPGWGPDHFELDWGAIYVYDLRIGKRIIGPKGNSPQELGASVAIHRNRVVGGAPRGDFVNFQYLPRPLGERYCSPAQPNSSGAPGEISASGDKASVCGALLLAARHLPREQFGLFLASPRQGFVPAFGGGQGDLCLDPTSVHRIPGSFHSGPTGEFGVKVDLMGLQPGDSWNFQAWYRDVNPSPTSNFTDGVSITFL